MTDLLEIRRVSETAARDLLRPVQVEEVQVEPEIGQDGDDLLRVRIVIPDHQADELDFDRFFTAIIKIKDEIKRTGDERRALVGFITPSELANRGDTES